MDFSSAILPSTFSLNIFFSLFRFSVRFQFFRRLSSLPLSTRSWIQQHSVSCSSCYQGTECSKPQPYYNLKRHWGSLLKCLQCTITISSFGVILCHPVGQSVTADDSDYLVCVWEHEDHEFLHYVSGVDGEEVLQLVHGHEPADLRSRARANINFTAESTLWRRLWYFDICLNQQAGSCWSSLFLLLSLLTYANNVFYRINQQNRLVWLDKYELK